MYQGMLRSAQRSLELGSEDPHEFRRCVSASYYAVYHRLAKAFADAFIGADPAVRTDNAWIEVYRGLDHATCIEACGLAIKMNVQFPTGLLNVAGEIKQLHKARLNADYNPRQTITARDAEMLFGLATECVEQINQCADRDLKAFGVWMLFNGKGTRAARAHAYPEHDRRHEKATEVQKVKKPSRVGQRQSGRRPPTKAR